MNSTDRYRVSLLSPSVGAEIAGVDFSREIDQQTVTSLKHLLGERGVLVGRAQALTPEQQVALAGRFGSVIVNPYFSPVAGNPQIAEVRKEPDQAQNIGENWHTDNSYDTAPALGSLLYALEVPPLGGDTIFVNMHAVFESLSAGLKRTLRTLKALHSTRHVFSKEGQVGEKDLDGRLRTDVAHREAVHPVVIKHPLAEREVLFVNPVFTTHIEGWTGEESKALLDYLYTQALRPEFQYRLRWEKGTFALWDNRATWHYAVNDYHGRRRLMHRVQIEGVSLS